MIDIMRKSIMRDSLMRKNVMRPYNPVNALGSSLLFWLDFTDLSTFTPNGSNKISSINDKSIYGHVLTQGIDLLQPTYLATGFNNGPCGYFSPGLLATSANLPLSTTNKVTVIAAHRSDSVSVTAGLARLICELSPDTNSVQTGFYAGYENNSGATVDGFHAAMQGNAGYNGTAYNSYFTATPQIMMIEYDKSVAGATPQEVNLVQNGQTLAKQGGLSLNNTNNFGNHIFYVGGRSNGSLPLNGRIATIMVINRLLNGIEVDQLMAYLYEQLRFV